MKSKKIWIKLCLDLAMLVVMMLLLWKDGMGMEFHEIAGLGLLAAFLVHILLNWCWVFEVTKRFFGRSVPVRTRICWLLDAGLLVCFVCIGVSGVFMSRTLFHFSVEGNWKVLHFFCSGLALILVGIHLGLHLTMIGNVLCRRPCLRTRAAGAAAACLAVLIMMTGFYSISSTSFSRWITMPFEMSAPADRGERPPVEGEKNGEPTGERPDQERSDRERLDQERPRPENENGEPGGADGESAGQPDRRKIREKASVGAIVWKAVQYVSICLLTAILTWGIDWIFRRRKSMRFTNR